MTNESLSDIFPLAAEFPAARREDWLKLVTAALKGAPFEKLVSRTYDDLRIEPLYGRDAKGEPRGRAPGAPWQVLARVDHPERRGRRGPPHGGAEFYGWDPIGPPN